MPYIKEEDREKFDEIIEKFDDLKKDLSPTLTSGDLNYLITKIIDSFLWRKGYHPKYQDYNDVIGVLECAKMELYRRQIAPYENKKMDESGDVYF